MIKNDSRGEINRSNIAKLIETAVEENRLSLRYQPIISLRGGSQERYEVFLQMVDQDGQEVPSIDLFQVAENTHLSVHLDQWVLQQTINTLKKEKAQAHQIYFFIKLSNQAIKDERLLHYIEKQVKSNQLAGEQLIFEISESIAIDQINLAQTFIDHLKTFRCCSALEHFGTSLNFEVILKHLPVDYVKIDASYSKGLLSDPEDQQRLQDIVRIVHELEKQTITVSVEDAHCLAILWSSDVDFAQGNYIQEPLPELEFNFFN